MSEKERTGEVFLQMEQRVATGVQSSIFRLRAFEGGNLKIEL